MKSSNEEMKGRPSSSLLGDAIASNGAERKRVGDGIEHERLNVGESEYVEVEDEEVIAL